MNTTTSAPPGDAKLHKILREDISRGDFFHTVRRDYADVKEFFLDDERKQRLAQMKRLKRWIYTTCWLLKALFLKLTPARRILVVIGLLLLVFSHTIHIQGGSYRIETSDFSVLGGMILLFVLMLELKDKLLARDELEAGHAVQAELMPEPSPEVPGWSLWLFTRTANDVGGDLVDFQRLDGDRFGVTLADVAGKGLKAALLTAKFQATLRALAPETTLLATLASRINHIFCRDGIRSMFASFVFAELTANSGSIRYINAGHHPPLLLRENGIEESRKGGPAIGLTESAEYYESEIAIASGDVVVMYSDGLTDSKNVRDEFYGLQRVRAILPSLRTLSAPVIGERILHDVDAFIGEAKIFDDLSLVILKREEAS